MQLLFRPQTILDDEQVWSAKFNLTDVAHSWYMQMTTDAPTTEWAAFTQHLIYVFNSPTDL